MQRYILVASGLILTGLFSAPGLNAQALADEALEDFPAQTQRLEYSNSAKLRAVPNYNNLKDRYLGARLQKLEKSLEMIGVRESDIDEVVLGWKSTGGKDASDWALYGLAAGHFNSTEIANQAASQGLNPTPVGNVKAYCLLSDESKTCLAVIDDTRGAFGSLHELSLMLAARSGNGQGLNSSSAFANLVNETKCDAPIWGAAQGAAISDWLRASMPAPDSNMQLDWSQAFSNVDTLAYTINATDKVHLEMKLGCRTSTAALSLHQVLDGLRVFQQMAWQTKYPNLPNPFGNVIVTSSGSQVELNLDTPYPGV